MRHEERAERLVRRIENFSDLVIGFSLALLALSLVIPPHIAALVADPWWLIAYFWTFSLIASLWYSHQRLFTHFFWPENLSLILNFAFLSTMGLLIFFVQVFVHYTSDFDKVWAFLAYFSVQAIALLLLGSLYFHGTRKRWEQLDPDLRYTGVRQATRGLVSGVFILAGVIVAVLRSPTTMDGAYPVAYVSIVGMLAIRVAMRAVKPRIVTAQDA
jgi:uncharacterized membrane protein